MEEKIASTHTCSAATILLQHTTVMTEKSSYYLVNNNNQWLVGNTSHIILKSSEYYSHENISDPNNLWYFSAQTSKGWGDKWFSDKNIQVAPAIGKKYKTEGQTMLLK